MDLRKLKTLVDMSLIHIFEPTSPLSTSYAVLCLKKKTRIINSNHCHHTI